MPSVLFVCTANLCRSPIAMVLFQQRLRESCPELESWGIKSAGTWTTNGQACPTSVIRVMAERGLDLRSHRSRMVTGEILDGFDLVLVMEKNHKEALQIEFPDKAKRIFLLTEMAGQTLEILDPFGNSPLGIKATADSIDEWLAISMEKIIEFCTTRK